MGYAVKDIVFDPIPDDSSHPQARNQGDEMDIKQKIEAANQTAVKRMIDGDPVLVDIAPAIEVIPGMKDRMITHSGPPIPWSNMCALNAALLLAGPVRGGPKLPKSRGAA